MGTQPKKSLERVQFYEDHLAPFATNKTAIGLVDEDITNLTAKTEAARAAYNTQQAALTTSKASTEGFANAVAALSAAGEDVLNKIRGKAKMTGNPAVYTLAQIPAPATPTPVGELGQPGDFKVALDPVTGMLDIKWKNTNPKGATGVVYQMWRSFTNNDADYEYLGGVGKKKFTDENIPSGTAQLYYKIQAVRSTSTGPFALLVVKFGTGSSGVTVTTLTQPKMAA